MLGKVTAFPAMYVLAFVQADPAPAAFDASRFDEARTILERQRKPASPAILARVYLQWKLPEQAAPAARLAEASGATLPEVQHQLALYFAQPGDRPHATGWAGRFAQSPAADPSAPLRAAMLYAEVRQWPEAAKFGYLALTRQDRPEYHKQLLGTPGAGLQ